MDAGGEIYTLQNFDSSNAAKECAQESVAFFRNKRARFTRNYLTYQHSFSKA
jgi:hypothetical protein